MSPTCVQIDAMLPHVTLGDLDECLRAEALDHAAACPRCAAAAAFYRNLDDAVAAGSAPAPPPVYFEGVLADIHRRLPRAAPRVLRPVLPLRLPGLSRQARATAILASFIFVWAAGVGGALRGSTHTPAPTAALPPGVATHALAAPQVAPPRVELVWFPRAGWVREDSGLLQMSPAELQALGLVPAASTRRPDSLWIPRGQG